MKGWSGLSVCKRLLIFVGVMLIMGGLIWALLGYPAMTEEGYLRRMERANLLPEGEILLRIDTQANGPDFLAVENGEYLELCRLPQRDALATRSEGFYLYRKAGKLTAVSLPSQFYGTVPVDEDGNRLTKCAVLLFDDRPEVQRVELSFAIGEETFVSKAQREVGGIFLCHYQRDQEAFYGDELWQDYLPEIQNCTARLYDARGELIEETAVPIGEMVG